MQMFKFVRHILVAIIIASFGLATTAFGQVTNGAAVVTTNVNMRVGPGTSYAVVDVLFTGDQVAVNRCRSGWCLVDFGRDRGWVSQTFLRQLISSPGGGNRPGGPGFDFAGRACFFENADFRGRSFCLRQGEEDRSLGRWENRITSISIEGRSTTVDACTDRNFRNCSTFTRDVPILNFMLQQNISSVSVK
jgi:hypothetical protein